MARMGNPNWVKKEPVVENTTENTNTNDQMQLVLQKIADLEKQNEELKKSVGVKENANKKAKERYSGPRTYSYKLRGGIPVLSFVSFKKDPTKDLEYKNQFGLSESNHYLRLKLADGTEQEVEVIEFNKGIQRSERMFCEIKTSQDGSVSYGFQTKDFGNFYVSNEAIN